MTLFAIFIALIILSANGVVVPTVAWVLAWVGLGLLLLKAILETVAKQKEKDLENFKEIMK